jgi:arylsulfatase A-like enzyme
MKRREFIKTCSLAASTPVDAFFKPQPRSEQTAKRPNILLFLVDDLGWGDVGYHGGVNRTPVIDFLAQQGVELDQHYVYPQCSPTRLSLLTGLYSSRFGIQAATNDQTMPLGNPTLASELKKQGYKTALIGKWHLGSEYAYLPNKYGFDHSYGNMTGACHPLDHTYRKGRFERTWHRNGKRLDEKGHTTDLITEEAIHWLRRQGEAPWFLYVPFTAVHLPVGAPPQWIESYRDIKFSEDSKIDESKRRYAAMVSHMDDAMGRIIRTVEEQGSLENTLVIFLSDNGSFSIPAGGGDEYGGDPPLISFATGTNHPLRGEKSTSYEGGIRVPACVFWKGELAPQKVTAPLSIADWMPTLMQAAGAQPDRDMQWDGINIWPQLTGEIEKPALRTIYIRYDGGMNALRRGDWKLVTLGDSEWARERMPGEDRSDQLFNLAEDPLETHNQAKKSPEILAELQQLLKQEMVKDEQAQRAIWEKNQ